MFIAVGNQAVLESIWLIVYMRSLGYRVALLAPGSCMGTGEVITLKVNRILESNFCNTLQDIHVFST